MKKVIVITLCVQLMLISAAWAIPTDVFSEDLPEQDPLFVPNFVHELGTNVVAGIPYPFPPEEEIAAVDTITEQRACEEDPPDDPGIPNALVMMTNKTTMNWRDVWYVADPETGLSNWDGLVNDTFAFKIDRVGVNRPLVSESFLPNNGIFEAGETWQFIIQDYTNLLLLPASALGSVGVPSFGDQASSGSIIAIPEPVTMVLLAMGGVALVRRRG